MSEIVDFNLAKKLKEKGYPQSVVGKYDMKGACFFEDGRFYEDGCIANVEDCFTAPMIHQVLKWLREEHNLHISTRPYCCEDGVKWAYKIRRFNAEIVICTTSKAGFDDSEQASIAGIKCVLDNLI